MFTAALFTVAKRQKQPKCPSTDESTKMMRHIYNGILHSHCFKNEILPFTATLIDL